MKTIRSYLYKVLDLSKSAPIPIKPSVELKKFNIWMEGYSATGEHQDASYLGKHSGRNFQDACMRYFLKEALRIREEADINGESYDTKRWDYDPYKNTYWACGLFETEKEARKSFG